MELGPCLYYHVYTKEEQGLWFSFQGLNYKGSMGAYRSTHNYFYLSKVNSSPEGDFWQIALRDSEFEAGQTYCYLKPDADTYLDISIFIALKETL